MPDRPPARIVRRPRPRPRRRVSRAGSDKAREQDHAVDDAREQIGRRHAGRPLQRLRTQVEIATSAPARRRCLRSRMNPSVPHHMMLRWPNAYSGRSRTSSTARVFTRPGLQGRRGGFGLRFRLGCFGSGAFGQNQPISAIAHRHRADRHRPGREDRADEQAGRRERRKQRPDRRRRETRCRWSGSASSRCVTSTSRMSLRSPVDDRPIGAARPTADRARRRTGSRRNCRAAAARRWPIRACRRPTDCRRRARRGAGCATTLTRNTTTLSAISDRAERWRSGSACPSPAPAG